MDIPSVERTTQVRPPGADGVVPASALAHVIPLAPINPSVTPAQPVPGVIDHISPAARSQAARGDAAQGAPDPLRGGTQADNSQRGWTERAADAEKAHEQPREPLTKMLIEQVHAMWEASAKAVEYWWQQYLQAQSPAQQQVLQQSRNQVPAAVPGVSAREPITYSPGRVQKNEPMERSNPGDNNAA